MTVTAPATEVHFARGIPPQEAIPSAELARITGEVLDEHGPAMFQYAPIGRYLGDPALRAGLGARYGADPDAILVTTGSLQALDLVLGHLLDTPDPLVVAEAPSYDRALRIMERHGARVETVPLLGDGPDTAALRALLRTRVPDVVYTIPDFQNPAGVTASAARRAELAALAAEYGFTIVEDIPYRELRFTGTAPDLLRHQPGGARVVTIGSLSKTLSPGLRVGFAVSDPDTARELAARSEGVSLSPVPLGQAVAARALSSGLVDDAVTRACALLHPRHDAAVAVTRELLGDALIAEPGGGYYLGVRLPVRTGEDAFVAAAAGLGLRVVPGSAFHPAARPPAPGHVFVRLPFQSLSPDEFASGVARLAGLAG